MNDTSASLLRVNVVIVTFNNVEMLSTLLKDLRCSAYPISRVIVIDNASKDDTAERIPKNFPEIEYIRLGANTGSGGGYYRGFKEAVYTGDLIWTLDDDVRLYEDSLEKLIIGMQTINRSIPIGAVRSVGINYNGPNLPSRLEIAPWRGTLFKVEMVKRIGLPREEYFLYGEDLEYSLRMDKNGFHCYWVPESICYEDRMEQTITKMVGKEAKIHATPFRHYYAFRNEVNIHLEYKKVLKLYRTLLYGLKVIGYYLFVEPKTGPPIISAVLKGIKDGFSGRKGMKPSYTTDLDIY